MADAGPQPELRQVLYGWQIFMIAISSVIGVTIFFSVGEALEVAGPGGALLALAAIGVVGILMMEGLSEMIQMFPTPNALMEYVRAFVDPDLAWVVGIAYWYSYSAIFASQIIAAAQFSGYWNMSQTAQTITFYFATPFILLFINFAGVAYFGWVETVGGILKIAMVFGGGIFMYVVHGHVPPPIAYIDEGFTHTQSFTTNGQKATCYVIPIVAYGWLGIEMIGVTAFEARDLRALRNPSRLIAYFTFALYLFTAIGEFLNVDYTDPELPIIYDGTGNNTIASTDAPGTSRAIIIIAALKGGYKQFPGLLNGCMMFSVLSAANTALYISSRAMYGMTRTIHPWKGFRWLRMLGTVWHRNGVPMWALFISAIAFFWLPFLQLKANYTITNLLEIMNVSASVACLFVWGTQCLAFIRYYAALSKHRKALAETYPEFNRWASSSQSSTFLAGLQPFPAWGGLIGCFLIVLIFTSATWWDTPITFSKVAVAYGATAVLLVFFLILKLINRRGWVKIDDDSAELFRILEHLKYLKPERQPSRRFWRRKAKPDPQEATPSEGTPQVELTEMQHEGRY